MEELKFYESLCRKLGSNYKTSVELKSYDNASDLLFDLDQPLFRGNLDVIFLCVFSESSLDIASLIREAGFEGLIIVMGTKDVTFKYEKLFDYNIFNFVRRGSEEENIKRLVMIIKKAIATINQMDHERLMLSYAGEIRVIRIDDIVFFQKQGKGLIVHYGDGEQFYFISSLVKLQNNLKGKGFFRSSLSYLVSLHAVKEVSRAEVVMLDGTKIPVGRQYYSKLKDELQQMREML